MDEKDDKVCNICGGVYCPSCGICHLDDDEHNRIQAMEEDNE